MEKGISIAREWGVSEPAARIWIILFLSEDHLTQKEIAERAGYSLSLVSPTLKILDEKDKLCVKKGKGKEKLYSFKGSFIEIFAEMQRRILETDIKPAIQILEKMPDRKRNRRIIKDYRKLESFVNKTSKVET